MAHPPGRDPRYREIARSLERAIRGGGFPAGARLPSVRALCRQWKASITTVAAAYRELERTGLVAPRAQSGHFVRASPPERARERPSPVDVGLNQMALMLMRDGSDERLAPFGPALPDPGLLPVAELERITAGLARRHRSDLARYAVPPGSRALRMAIAQRAAAIGCPLAPDDLVVSSGALDALTLALRLTCRAGDAVAIESPMYYGLLQSIEALRLRVVEVPADPRTGLLLPALREALDEHRVAAVVTMTTCSNPTGSIMPDAARRELVELLAERDIPLIEDDALGDLAHGGERPRPAKAFDRAGLVLWCSSFSKAMAPGLRLGWIAPGRYAADIEHLQFTSSTGASAHTQAVAAEYLSSGRYPRHLRRACAAYAERTAAMAAAVLRHFPEGTRLEPPRGGFALWVELPEGCDAQKLYAAAVASGISIAPGPLFSPKLRYRRFIRLSAARWSAAYERQMRALGTLVRNQVRG